MNQSLEFISSICLIVSCVLLGGVVLIRWFQRTKEHLGKLVLKIVFTLPVLLLIWFAFHARSTTVLLVPGLAVVGGLVFSVLWAPAIGAWLCKPITSMIDGGDEAPDPKPYYSIARALAARGKYEDSVVEIKTQLEKFPADFEGWMLLAELQATHLNDLLAAETTIQNLCDQSGQSPKNAAAALTTLADWHLKLARNRDAGRKNLEQIIALFPDSDFSAAAAQRIAHLGDAEMFRPPAERHQYPVPEGIRNFGLRSEAGLIKPRETSPKELAAQFVKQLEEHPLDTEAREKLAVIYAEHYHRLDMATCQLEQLIDAPNQPMRQVVRWLNLLADLQVRCVGDYAAARKTLQRIVDRFPNVAAAEVARNRIGLLRLETKGQEKTTTVKLGTYEQNIGLKLGAPRHRG